MLMQSNQSNYEILLVGDTPCRFIIIDDSTWIDGIDWSAITINNNRKEKPRAYCHLCNHTIPPKHKHICDSCRSKRRERHCGVCNKVIPPRRFYCEEHRDRKEYYARRWKLDREKLAKDPERLAKVRERSRLNDRKYRLRLRLAKSVDSKGAAEKGSVPISK